MHSDIKVKKEDYVKAMLTIINFNLKLSELELDIITAMINNNMTVVNIDSREIIRKVLNKDKYITNNYIKRLRSKGVFLEKPNDKQFYINPNILDILKDKEVSFKFHITE